MPELPEVETIRRDLSDKITGKEINEIKISKDSALKKSQENFSSFITEKNFSKIDRRGKLLIFDVSNSNHHVLSHMRMTGKLIYQPPQEEVEEFPTKHTGIIFYFADDSELYFDDIRTFGYMHLVDSTQKENILEEKLGIEPLQDNFTLKNFEDVLENRTTDIKSILLKQRAIAGIGNIYADEICFESKVKPDKKIPKLNQKQIKSIWKNCEVVLKEAIDHRGTTFQNYVDSSGNGGNFKKKLKVYGRKNDPCYSCNNSIKKIKHKGRGTHFCPSCQS